jgi:hypothetical protein
MKDPEKRKYFEDFKEKYKEFFLDKDEKFYQNMKELEEFMDTN